jgi:hypothetical protein
MNELAGVREAARELAARTEQTARAMSALKAAIKNARAAGNSLRVIASAAGVSHEYVRKLQ